MEAIRGKLNVYLRRYQRFRAITPPLLSSRSYHVRIFLIGSRIFLPLAAIPAQSKSSKDMMRE